jgi:hypothetical protein
MAKIGTLIALMLLLPVYGSAQAQGLQDPLLDHLIGTWVLRGTIGGKDTTHDVTFDWVLAHQYVRLHEVSRERDARGQPAYEATVFIGWDAPSGRYACLWLDSTGGTGISAQAIGYAGRAHSELAFVFKIADGSTFHTTFKYNQTTNAWQWLMDEDARGTRRSFARVTLTKK